MSRPAQVRPRDPKTGRLFRLVNAPTLSPPPPALRRAASDNLALVPGSVLLERAKWRAVAEKLPRGQVLIVLPKREHPQHQTVQRVADRMRANGQAVTTLPIDQPHPGAVKP